MRTMLSAVALAGVLACAADSSGPALPPAGPPAAELALLAEIDGFEYRATASRGFDDDPIVVNKGGVRLYVDVENAGRHVDGPVRGGDFEIRVAGGPDGAPLPERVAFTRYDDFSGALYWIAPGQTVPAWLGLWHKTEEHWDAGPFRVDIRRRSHGEPDAPAPPE